MGTPPAATQEAQAGDEAGASDPWVDALRRNLVPVEGLPGPVPEDQRAQAAKAAERALREMGKGIDPAPVLLALDRFAGALRIDPSCVDAYVGVGKAVLLLAPKRPRHADAMCSHAIEWLQVATTRIGPVQASPAVHATDAKLRELRAAIRSRPKAVEGVEVDVVRLDRDRDGRVKGTGRPEPRFRPPSVVLKALLDRATSAPEPQAMGRTFVLRAAFFVGVVGLLLVAITAFTLRDGPAPPSWAHPTLAARVQDALGAARPLLEVDARLHGDAPAGAVVVVDHGAGRPALPDPLNAVLPQAAATGDALRSLVVVRRYEGEGGHLLLAWVVDLEPPARVVARAAFAERDENTLDARAHAWLTEVGWR